MRPPGSKHWKTTPKNEQGAEGLSGGSTLLARYSSPQRRSLIVGGEKRPFNPPYGRFGYPS